MWWSTDHRTCKCSQHALPVEINRYEEEVCVCVCCEGRIDCDWSWREGRVCYRRSWRTEMTNAETALCSARRHQGQPEGGYRQKPAGGILAHAQQGALNRPHPAWNLLFSRILPDLCPPFYSQCLPSHSAHQQTPNEAASSKQTPAQPARSPPPPGSQGARRRHFTRTDDAAKTTIMIINLLNLEDYAVN